MLCHELTREPLCVWPKEAIHNLEEYVSCLHSVWYPSHEGKQMKCIHM